MEKLIDTNIYSPLAVYDESEIDLQQRVYIALDEPDGVAGVAAVRCTEATLNEQILQYESTGMHVRCTIAWCVLVSEPDIWYGSLVLRLVVYHPFYGPKCDMSSIDLLLLCK